MMAQLKGNNEIIEKSVVVKTKESPIDYMKSPEGLKDMVFLPFSEPITIKPEPIKS